LYLVYARQANSLRLPASRTSYANATARYTYRIPELENIWEYYLALIQRLRLYADNELISINSMGAAIDDTSQLDALREALVNIL
jgi:ATP-dependent DNA helicase RecG